MLSWFGAGRFSADRPSGCRDDAAGPSAAKPGVVPADADQVEGTREVDAGRCGQPRRCSPTCRRTRPRRGSRLGSRHDTTSGRIRSRCWGRDHQSRRRPRGERPLCRLPNQKSAPRAETSTGQHLRRAGRPPPPRRPSSCNAATMRATGKSFAVGEGDVVDDGEAGTAGPDRLHQKVHDLVIAGVQRQWRPRRCLPPYGDTGPVAARRTAPYTVVGQQDLVARAPVPARSTSVERRRWRC